MSRFIETGVPPGEPDSRYAWLRLLLSLILGTLGGIGMWSYMVALPAVQADFGVTRGEAALPYTVAMVGFAIGGILAGRLVDKFGIIAPLLAGSATLGVGYITAASAPNVWMLAAAHGVIGAGCSTTFGPLIADVSHWFVRRRGIAVAIFASGNYLAGAVWPPIVQHFISQNGWRATHIGIGIACLVTIPPLVFMLQRPPPLHGAATASATAASAERWRALGLSPNALQMLLCIAGVGCCVAMAMPQVHIVSYCGELGYGVARGAEMLSLMLAFGIISRVASGFIADRIGGVRTLLLGSLLQAVALLLYLMFDGLFSLYVISALFGLFQGGIVPSYAIIVREYFPPQEAATRVGITLTATIGGMALGGWLSGVIFDFTGSYSAAFANGLLWNALNLSIILWLFLRQRPQRLVPA